MSMFCYQCEQTAKNGGCEAFGVCGKDPDTAALQDLLVYVAKGVAVLAHQARGLSLPTAAGDAFVEEALFATVTNVDFDPLRLEAHLHQGAIVRDGLAQVIAAAGGQTVKDGPASWRPAADLNGLIAQGELVSVEARKTAIGADLAGLEELVVYGLKGTAAYAHHARVLGQTDDEVSAFFHQALAALTADQDQGALLTLSLEVGRVNLRVMELLDAANTGAYGHPVPTPVRIHPVKGKAILVSGHDLKDLEVLLEQTAGKGINIYTHGEMLPAHGYPELKKHGHLVGNYGGAWQDQRKEFDAFPGAILMTTNCIQKPKGSYQPRLFTCGLVAWPGVTHIDGRDFAPVIEAALAADGFSEDGADKTILTGFGHNAVLGVADKVIEAVKAGDLKHFFLIGGCDGAKPGRDYYTDFAEAVPDDCAILTLACGKFRFNKLEFGDIGGIPRLLDVGQCNDAYSAVKIAVALAEAFECGVNDLPLSMILSWYEQKAVCILLSLLHLGIKKIRLGPSLPAFITPAVLNVLVDAFELTPIGSVEEDLAACLGS
jgi:hydroxylamine reductase